MSRFIFNPFMLFTLHNGLAYTRYKSWHLSVRFRSDSFKMWPILSSRSLNNRSTKQLSVHSSVCGCVYLTIYAHMNQICMSNLSIHVYRYVTKHLFIYVWCLDTFVSVCVSFVFVAMYCPWKCFMDKSNALSLSCSILSL